MFALLGALLFLVTSASLTIAVIWQSVENNSSSTNTTSNNTTASKTSSTKNSKKLEGTKLQNFTPVSQVNSLQMTDTKIGSGQVAKAGQKVTVLYTGAIASTGIVFQSTQDTGQPVQVTLSYPNGVIEGWAKGVPGMRVGGERRLLIPADEAYGSNPPSGIPDNAALVFDVTLLQIN